MKTKTDPLPAVGSTALFALVRKWRFLAAEFRAKAGEYELAKHESGLGREMRHHNKMCKKHMDACCRMIEECSNDLERLCQANNRLNNNASGAFEFIPSMNQPGA